MKYNAEAGEHIDKTAHEMCELASTTGERVTSEFNDVHLQCGPKTKPEEITAYYMDYCDKRRAEYEASPEGIAARKRQEEAQAEAAKAKSEGLLPFTLAEGKQERWNKRVGVNSDPYGACVIRYAARWANAMEREMNKGKRLADVAEAASREADKEGITGFMYGCAVVELTNSWVHGEALRLWHNRCTQIGTEGDEANGRDGVVLNPAMLCVR